MILVLCDYYLTVLLLNEICRFTLFFTKREDRCAMHANLQGVLERLG